MKKLIIGTLAFISTSTFAQTTPNFIINDEQFRATIIDAFQKSSIMAFIDHETVIDAQASYLNGNCNFNLKITSEKLKLNSSLSRTTKNLAKCQSKIAKFIIKDIAPF